MINLGINGFGRIGRAVFRMAVSNPDRFRLCGLNLRNRDMRYLAYAAKYDSSYGVFPGTVEVDGDALVVNGAKVPVLGSSVIDDIRWDECGAEYIIESTGAFNTTEAASGHLRHGGKKVILTAPAKDKETPTFVMGVNNTEYDPASSVVSNASCTTNCLAPLAKVVNDKFGIMQGLMTTIHACTSKQKTVDARGGKDLRIGRSVFNNIIPTTTGAAKAVGKVIPALNGRLTGMAIRVPAPSVSVVDLTARLAKKTSYGEVMAALEEAEATYLKGILTCTKDAVVSTDLRGETHTCIVDEQAGLMIDDDFIKLIAWYDNEWGYSAKVLELAEYIDSVSR